MTDVGGKEWWRYPCNGLAFIPGGEEILLFTQYNNIIKTGIQYLWQQNDTLAHYNTLPEHQ